LAYGINASSLMVGDVWCLMFKVGTGSFGANIETSSEARPGN
jgi:hypothetical protein